LVLPADVSKPVNVRLNLDPPEIVFLEKTLGPSSAKHPKGHFDLLGQPGTALSGQ